VLNELQVEEERLAALYAYGLLDTAASDNFDRLCQMAMHSFQVPIAVITLVDRDRLWFKSRIGIELEECPRKDSFCSYTIKQREVLEVRDARHDSRFCHHPQVSIPSGICFYAGAPLVTAKGFALGSICILDTVPRELTEADRQQLNHFAELVMQQIEARHWSRGCDAVSHLPSRPPFIKDAGFPFHQVSGEQCLFVMVDILDSYRAREIARAFGIRPFERFVRTLSQRLSHQLNGTATIYQITQTRFAFIMAAHQGQDYERLLDRLIVSLRKTVIVEEVPIDPPVSAGVIAFDAETDDIGDVLRKALSALDEALTMQVPWLYYEAGYDERFRRSFNLAADVKAAMEHDHFYLVFQPRLDVATQTLIGAEVLLRWKHPNLGLIPPGDFIPVIEKSSLMCEVTRWIIDKALAQLAVWGTAFSGCLSINLSPRDFDGRQLVERFVMACAEHHIDPNRIELEITEGEWLEDNSNVLMQLADLRKLGAHIAIDDFGSGYSNFAYLHKIPAHVVKLDRSLIYQIESDPRKQVLAQHIVSLVNDLGYRTVAEGIETKEAFDHVRAYGCTEAQGYWFARPLEAPAFITWCTTWEASNKGSVDA
jgi:EAL domain-containing protein (putative c-di-GMP-specific phosphodiesterase class I)/GGDEF domain-containing protein